ncbi:MAG: hypothetical protein IRZ09_00765 [Variibacter sp.]|nr:hypothetical protein [Variibacter sp.]
MSLLKRLFGFGSSSGESVAPAASTSVEYRGFTIRAEPYLEGGQYQAAGVITKIVGGVAKEHHFIRADRYPALDQAVEISLEKGRRIVDERGERMFD